MKISELPKAAEITGEEILPVVQNGETKKVTRDDFVGTVPDGLTVENGKMFLTSKGEKVDEGAQLPTVTVDDELSAESTNPVENRVVTANFANALKGTASGKYLDMRDISPITHALKVKAESETSLAGVTVKQYGKNLVDFNQIRKVKTGWAEPTIIENGFVIEGKYYCSITNIPVLPNTDYYLSFITENLVGTVKNVTVGGDTSGIQLKQITNGTGGTLNSGNNTSISIYFFSTKTNEVGKVKFTDIQLEPGTQKTEYEPYVPVTEASVSEDGTVEGLTSIYPTTVIVGDGNVNLKCEYNKDLNKVINNIVDAVISLGGDV